MTAATTTPTPIKTINIRTAVTRPLDVVVEWDASMNKLRVENPETHETLAVYDNGEIYRVMPAAPRGSIVIVVPRSMPGIVDSLVHAKIIKVTRKTYDTIFDETVVTALVLVGA
jgi:hypothetical protein